MTPEQRNDLIHAYVQDTVDGMDTKTLATFVAERITQQIQEELSDELLLELIECNLPHLLEN